MIVKGFDTLKQFGVIRNKWKEGKGSLNYQIRGSIVVSISACHAEDPGSIPGRGVVKFNENYYERFHVKHAMNE